MQLLPTLLTTLIALQGPPAPAKMPQAVGLMFVSQMTTGSPKQSG